MQKSYVSKPGCIEEVKSSENGKTSVSLSDVEGFLWEEEAKKEFLSNPKDDYVYFQLNYLNEKFRNGEHLSFNSWAQRSNDNKVLCNVPLGSNFNRKLLWGDNITQTIEFLTDDFYVYLIKICNAINNSHCYTEIYYSNYNSKYDTIPKNHINFGKYFLNNRKLRYLNTFFKNFFKFYFDKWDYHKGLIFIDQNGKLYSTDQNDNFVKYQNKISLSNEFKLMVYKPAFRNFKYGETIKLFDYTLGVNLSGNKENSTRFNFYDLIPQNNNRSNSATIGGGGFWSF